MGSVTNRCICRNGTCQFQLTRSVGSVTDKGFKCFKNGEFQLTRSVGSVTPQTTAFQMPTVFQLTRSVGSVTLHIVYVKSHHHNRADILLKITLKSDIFYIICIIFSANLHINQYHCTFAHKIKLPSGSYVSFAPICSTLLFQLLPK